MCVKASRTHSVEETIKAGEDFAKCLKPNGIVLLYGEMGVGKTHFVKGIARAFLNRNKPVSAINCTPQPKVAENSNWNCSI